VVLVVQFVDQLLECVGVLIEVDFAHFLLAEHLGDLLVDHLLLAEGLKQRGVMLLLVLLLDLKPTYFFEFSLLYHFSLQRHVACPLVVLDVVEELLKHHLLPVLHSYFVFEYFEVFLLLLSDVQHHFFDQGVLGVDLQ